VIRRGRQYLREISGDGQSFGFPSMLGGVIRSVVAWSRIFHEREVLIAVNTDFSAPRTAWVTIDARLHAVGHHLTCRYSTDGAQIGSTTAVAARNGAAVRFTVPPAGLVIFE
jgi:hypothetical protein